jgi:tRNA pseudouridine38-40 synthase
MSNFKITLEYDGTNYSGWQIQKNTDQTIQQVLESCLTRLNKSPVKATASGRTDAGVHAKEQVVNFSLDVSIPEERLPFALNSLLPEDIICKKAEKVSSNFNARFDARGKRYRYRILNSSIPSVFTRHFFYNLRQPLNFNKLRLAARKFIGKHDFAAFQAKGSDVNDTVRTIKDITIRKHGCEYRVDIIGNGFLYKMVRIMVGTLIEIGLKKRKPDINQILKSKDRKKAGFTAPAKGLTLVKVYY